MHRSMYLSASLTLLLALAGAGLSPALHAAPKLVPVEGVAYNVGASMEDNLRALEGRMVTLVLRGGTTLAGRVKAVGSALLHLEELDRKEHFDALVRIGDVVAVDTRFRTLER